MTSLCFIVFILTQETFTSSKSTIETLKKCEICLKLTIKTPEGRQSRLYDVFIINCERILHIFLVFLFLSRNRYVCWTGPRFMLISYLVPKLW